MSGNEKESWEIIGWLKRSKGRKTINANINGIGWCVIQKNTLQKLMNEEVDGCPIKKCPEKTQTEKTEKEG